MAIALAITVVGGWAVDRADTALGIKERLKRLFVPRGGEDIHPGPFPPPRPACGPESYPSGGWPWPGNQWKTDSRI